MNTGPGSGEELLLPPDPDHVPVGPPQNPSEVLRRPRRRRSCCYLGVFVILCALAALGTWLSRQARQQGFEVPSISIPQSLPWAAQLPSAEPQPTPHVLPKTLEGATKVLRPVVEARFRGKAEQLGIEWPPARTRLVGLKIERSLELWIANPTGPFQLLKTYPVLAASGDIGPKRKKGDKQVPEGHYKVVHLNADSKYHLSFLLNFPNPSDKAREKEALASGTNLGGDICVHGSNRSAGCLAIGDSAIEEVFTLMALAKSNHRDVIIVPADFRRRPDLITLAGKDPEVLKLYTDMAKLMETVKP